MKTHHVDPNTLLLRRKVANDENDKISNEKLGEDLERDRPVETSEHLTENETKNEDNIENEIDSNNNTDENNTSTFNNTKVYGESYKEDIKNEPEVVGKKQAVSDETTKEESASGKNLGIASDEIKMNPKEKLDAVMNKNEGGKAESVFITNAPSSSRVEKRTLLPTQAPTVMLATPYPTGNPIEEFADMTILPTNNPTIMTLIPSSPFTTQPTSFPSLFKNSSTSAENNQSPIMENKKHLPHPQRTKPSGFDAKEMHQNNDSVVYPTNKVICPGGFFSNFSCHTAVLIQEHHFFFVGMSTILIFCLCRCFYCPGSQRVIKKDDRGEYRAVAEQYGTCNDEVFFADGFSAPGSFDEDDEEYQDDWSAGVSKSSIEMVSQKEERNGGLTLEEMNG